MTRARRELLCVLGAATALATAFCAKAYDIDEPYFLAIARHALSDPADRLGFLFNWYGQLVPMRLVHNTPPLLDYVLAADWALTGGREWLMRLALLPLDWLAAWSLYGLAARFLERPLWPALVAVLGPAYVIGLNHLMAEKLMAPLCFAALLLLVRALDDRNEAAFWGSAALLAAGLMSKYNAVFAAAPAAVYAWSRGQAPKRIAAWLAAAGTPLALYLAADLAWRGGGARAAWHVTSAASQMFWSSPSHRLRALLAFTGGCGVATALWPLALARRRPRLFAAAGLACAALFLPRFDLAPLVLPVDRWTGFLLSWPALYGLLLLGVERELPGWALWAPWIGSVAMLQGEFYWSVLARFILFLLPPAVFALAALCEACLREIVGRRLFVATAAACAALSVALSKVDYDYAAAQKAVAQDASARYLARGRRVWCASHWGLQHYLEAAGAAELDFGRGWSQIHPGDVLVLSRVNRQPAPAHPAWVVDRHVLTVGEPIPLRLLSGWTGEGAFYSSVFGFLPYSWSREPLEEFTIIEIRGAWSPPAST